MIFFSVRTEPPIKHDATAVSGDGAEHATVVRQQHARHVHQRRQLRYQHGDHSGGAAVRADMRAGAELHRAMRAAVRAALRRRDGGAGGGAPRGDGAEAASAQPHPGGGVWCLRRDRPGDRVPHMPRGVRERGQGSNAAQVQPRLPRALH